MNLTCQLRALPFIAALTASLLTGCAVGPNFKKPAAPDVSDYTAGPLSTTVATENLPGGEAQRFAKGSDISADWWTLFRSRPLNDLIELSLANNPDLKAAQAALTVAWENVLAQPGVFYPSVAASFSASRQRQSGQIAPTLNSNAFLFNLFTPQVSVSYVPDVFGLNRRTVESLTAQEQGVRGSAGSVICRRQWRSRRCAALYKTLHTAQLRLIGPAQNLNRTFHHRLED